MWPVQTELLAQIRERLDAWGRMFGELQLGEKQITVPGPPPRIFRPGEEVPPERKPSNAERFKAFVSRTIGRG